MAGGTTGTSRDTLGPLTDIARALKEWSQTSRSGALQGPTGATGATGATGPTGPQGPQGDPAPTITVYATTPVRANGGASAPTSSDITLSVNSATAVSLGVIALTGDLTGSATDVIVTGINEAQAPATPTSGDIGKVITVTAASTYGLDTIANLMSSELRWSDWGSRVTVLSAATATVVYSIDFTDAGRASQTWAIRVEYECILMRQTDPTQMSLSYDSDVVVATYNGSGVPTLLVAHEVTDGDEREWWAGGVPNVTSFQGNVSGTQIDVTLSKASGGADCYAKCRVRKCTEWRLDNW